MIGWEFPPFLAGGLGVACEGLVRGLRSLGCEISLVLPRRPASTGGFGGVVVPKGEPAFRVLPVETQLSAYPSAGADPYGPDLPAEVLRFARRVRAASLREDFDVIHAHDWMTFPAAIALHLSSGKAWIAHVHATEFARSTGEGNEFVSTVEREGTRRAARVICVSRRTADVVHRRYGVPEKRIRVVHNAIDPAPRAEERVFPSDCPMVLFAGRLTRQKAPLCFIEAARKVLKERPETQFVVVGTGDRREFLEKRAAQLGIADRVSFTGFLPRARLGELYRRATVFALPSVEEPFGLTVLEAAQRHVAAIVSRNAGVTEVVRSVVTIDPGDAEALARRIVYLLDSPVTRWLLARHAAEEVRTLSWKRAAGRCLDVYRELS
jgi:glycosyltransferase involved in cell wall biosynthesis